MNENRADVHLAVSTTISEKRLVGPQGKRTSISVGEQEVNEKPLRDCLMEEVSDRSIPQTGVDTDSTTDSTDRVDIDSIDRLIYFSM